MPEAAAVDDGLSDRDRAILDFEAASRTHAGAKASAIRVEFGWTTARYYQRLNELIDTEAALQYDALLVKRLMRIRDRRPRA